jgi:hypothetical protein
MVISMCAILCVGKKCFANFKSVLHFYLDFVVVELSPFFYIFFC